MEQGKQFVTVEIPDGKEAKWNEQGLLQLFDKKPDIFDENKPITERVKTFEDALRICQHSQEARKLADEYLAILSTFETEAKSEGGLVMASMNNLSYELLAYLRLRIVTAVLNEGWKPQFTEDERRWYPWFFFYTKEEIERQDDEWKDDKCLQLWLRGGYSGSGSYCGLACSCSNYAWSRSRAGISARLVFKSQELSDYAAKQFATLWAEYFTGLPCLPWRKYQEHEAKAKEASEAGRDDD